MKEQMVSGEEFLAEQVQQKQFSKVVFYTKNCSFWFTFLLGKASNYSATSEQHLAFVY